MSEMDSNEIEGQVATIAIPLTGLTIDPATTLDWSEIDILRSILSKFRNRNFAFAIPGWKFQGYVSGQDMIVNDDNGMLELILTVQF